MMSYEALQAHWLLFTLMSGLAVVIGWVLWYIAFWRPRHQPGREGPARVSALVPWVLIVIYVLIAAYAIVYVLQQAARPPNW